MTTFVEVGINLTQIPKSYHYHVPDELKGSIVPGSLVIVPFGSQRVQGVVLRFIETAEVSETRPVEEIVDEKPALTFQQIQLAHWLADETLAPLGSCIELMLPAGLSQQTDSLIQLKTTDDIDMGTLSSVEKRLINLLRKRGALRGRQIDANLRHIEWRGSMRKLAKQGIVSVRPVLPEPRVRPKMIKKVSLAITPDQIQVLDEPLSRITRVHERRVGILNTLARENQPLEPVQVIEKTGGNRGDLDYLKKANLIHVAEIQVWRDPLEDTSYIPASPPELTSEQMRAWEQIFAQLQTAQLGGATEPILLHGVTGSGKTELYLRAIKETLDAGKQVMVLVPEISLTPQTVKRLLARFPGKVGVMHSQLSVGERFDTWRRVRNGDLPVIIGPRSALFVPQEDLGLIIVDECHHESYDQQDSQPYYHGADTAVAYARLTGAAVILGSATPRLTQYYRALYGNWNYIELPKRILAHRESIAYYARNLGVSLPLKMGEGQTADLGLPPVSIVDMRQELIEGNRSIFSRQLQADIEHVLATHQQAILFLNRRGSATYVFCRTCGYVVKCPRDEKPLTYHARENRLICHTCGYQRQVPVVCPQCGSKQIRQLGIGTERVEKLIHERFPGVKTLRWDADTTREKGAHERILTHFIHREADILIGTQMLAKGLDLPLVTLVGVVLAEVGLNLPDYRAAERTFEVLTQVAGRAGRSPLGGKVVLQTYQPDHYAIQMAAKHDYKGFFEQEMVFRRQLGYPPFSRLVRLEFRHHDPIKVEETAREVTRRVEIWIEEDRSKTELIGPLPSYFSRIYGQYRWQIILRGPDSVNLLRERQVPNWIVEVDPSSLL